MSDLPINVRKLLVKIPDPLLRWQIEKAILAMVATRARQEAGADNSQREP
jgi:hypothetical protein